MKKKSNGIYLSIFYTTLQQWDEQRKKLNTKQLTWTKVVEEEEEVFDFIFIFLFDSCSSITKLM